jgi:hypothetical protein
MRPQVFQRTSACADDSTSQSSLKSCVQPQCRLVELSNKSEEKNRQRTRVTADTCGLLGASFAKCHLKFGISLPNRENRQVQCEEQRPLPGEGVYSKDSTPASWSDGIQTLRLRRCIVGDGEGDVTVIWMNRPPHGGLEIGERRSAVEGTRRTSTVYVGNCGRG